MARSKARQKTPKDPNKVSRLSQLRQAWTLTRREDPKLPLVVGAWALGVAVVVFVVFALLSPWWLAAILGVMSGILAGLIVFGRRAERSMYAQMEGRPGAAAGVLDQLKRGWKADPAIAFTKQQDLVHRVVGPCGIVLVGEGAGGQAGARLKQLMLTERRKHERVVSEVELHEVVVGRGEGQVPLPQLRRHLMKQKRSLRPADMTDVIYRLKALDAQRSPLPVPKGPMPTSMKGMRSQMRGR